jgi:predicted O-methyltransferase YrrM
MSTSARSSWEVRIRWAAQLRHGCGFGSIELTWSKCIRCLRNLTSREVRTIDGQLRQLHSNIDEAEGKFIQNVIRELKPKCSIEIGCAYGISSLFICEALADVGAERHIIIDPYQLGSGHEGPDSGYEGIGLLNLKRAGLDRIVDFHAELSFRCLPRLLEQGVKADFAFVDGMHTFDYAFADFFFLDKMLGPGGVVIFDDLGYPSIRKLCRYIVPPILSNRPGGWPANRG